MRGILIPANRFLPLKEIQFTYRDHHDIGEILRSTEEVVWPEQVHTTKTRNLLPIEEQTDNDSVVMAVDEDGMRKGLMPNLRASAFYPYGRGIVGDAILLGVKDASTPNRDYTDLPESVTLALVEKST
jgi:hypothetical protein